MNFLPDDILKKANQAAIYNLYLYLAHVTAPAENATLRDAVAALEESVKSQTAYAPSGKDIYRLSILTNAVKNNDVLASSELGSLTVSKSGMTACVFKDPSQSIFVVFRGTGKGEWIDNGEGLSGVPEKNTYRAYGEKGRVLSRKTVLRDHATEQQVAALNWFYSLAAKEGWTENTDIILTGHSKGGNKAQFVAIHTDLAKACYSFDGQGFSPEAIEALRARHGDGFDGRRQRIYSFSAENDYVNVLGERLMPPEQIYYFKSWQGIHAIEAMLSAGGRLRRQSEQGELSRYVEEVSARLMRLPPRIRKYATLGVMNIFQRFLGEGAPVGGDRVSIEQTVVGMGVAIDLLLGG